MKSTPGSIVSGTAKRCYEGRVIRNLVAGQTEFEQGLRVLENHPLDRYFSHLLMMMLLGGADRKWVLPDDPYIDKQIETIVRERGWNVTFDPQNPQDHM